MKLQGQWFGNLSPSEGADADVILNLDRRRGGFSGTAIVTERPDLPGELHSITIYPQANDREITGHTDLRDYFVTRNRRCQLMPRDDVLKHFPNLVGQVFHSDISGAVVDDKLTAIYKNDGAPLGSVECVRVSSQESSVVERQPLSWDEFKAMAGRATRESGLFIYRGQLKRWPIRTSFHRAGRFDLHRFSVEDISRLESAVTSVIDTTFQLSDNRHLGALLGIAQHHGFPTPLLDWTKSPYVAAYFACREALQDAASEPTIFRFDRNAWLSRNAPATDIGQPLPSLGFIEALPLRNARLLPQQSVLVYCNVDDFERFVSHKEGSDKATYLTGYTLTDPPGAVLRDLRMMGVYAASLFPGLDGMCRGVFEDSLEAD
jgi:hypothetical protein